jgi:hypothetical protein
MAAAQHDVATQVGDSGDDMAITAIPALAPRLRSITYIDNFKPNIQKYDGRSDPNIWLSSYYVAGKAADDNFDHMAAYAGDGRHTVALAQQPPGRQHHFVGRPVSGLHVEFLGDL